MTTTVPTIIPVTESDGLYCKYTCELNPQTVELHLDTRTGGLSCSYNPNIGGGTTFDAYNRLILTTFIPCFTATAANAFMQEIEPLARIVLAGADTEWDGNSTIGVLTAEAQDAWEQIVALCEAALQAEDPTLLVTEWDVTDWFNDGDANTISTLGITAATSDSQLADIATQQVQDAAANGTGYTILDHGAVLAHLTDLRAGLGFTVQIQAGSGEDDTIWRAKAPAHNVNDPGPADQVALDALTDDQNILALEDDGPWRVAVWAGLNADTSTEPDYTLDDQQWRDGVADALDHWEDGRQE